MTDPRVAPVEDNLLAFWATCATSPLFRREPADDLIGLHSDIDYPMFNAVAGARFGDAAERRTHEVVDTFVAAGRPWMWWLTPSSTSPALEGVLEERGLLRNPCPGMYLDLDGRVTTPTLPGVEIRPTDDMATYLDVLVRGFGMPSIVAEPMGLVIGLFPDAINVLAHLDGRAVGCGTAYLTGPTAGVYNIAVLEEVRGRGIGYAVTATLLDLAAEAGAEHAILHSSEDGLPVYERLGFVEVCQVPQYLWLPR